MFRGTLEVGLEKSVLNIKGRFGKDERREIISTVCQVNRAIYDAAQIAGIKTCMSGSGLLLILGEDKIDPLRDSRVKKVLQKS